MHPNRVRIHPIPYMPDACAGYCKITAVKKRSFSHYCKNQKRWRRRTDLNRVPDGLKYPAMITGGVPRGAAEGDRRPGTP